MKKVFSNYTKKNPKKTQKAHINVNQLKYELYFLNNQLFDDLGSHRIFFFVEEVGGHLHFVKCPLWQQFRPFVTLQGTSKIG